MRTAAFLAPLSLLLAVPAFDPFVALVLEGAIVVAGVRLARHRSRGEASPGESRGQFRLSTLLLLTILMAAGTAIFVRLPGLNRQAWQSMVLIGLAGGLATLLAAWAPAAKSRSRRVTRCVAALGLAVAIGLIMKLGDWFVPALVEPYYSWPPEPTSLLGPLASGKDVIWPTVIPLVAAVVFVVALRGPTISPGAESVNAPPRRTRSLGQILMFGLVAAPATWMLYCLHTPLTIPLQDSQRPNGYEDLVAAGEQFAMSTVLMDPNAFPAINRARHRGRLRPFGGR